MARHYDVITIGETTMDSFMTLHDSASKVHLDLATGELCFKHGEKINVERYDFSMGGNATNVAVGIARLGLKATICSEIGDDEFSIKIRNALAKEGIERLLMVQGKNAPSSFAVIINFKGDRTVFIEDVEREHNFNWDEVSAKYMYLTSMGNVWEHAYEKALDFAILQKCKIAFNPGHLQLSSGRDTIHKVLKATEILFINKEEGELILHNHYNKKVDNTEHYIKALCKDLQELGPKTVVLTNGKHGSFALSESGEFYERDLTPGKIVERTGAGDAYASGFLSAIVHGLDIKTAMDWGSQNASAVVGAIGSEAGLLKKEEMEERLES